MEKLEGIGAVKEIKTRSFIDCLFDSIGNFVRLSECLKIDFQGIPRPKS